MFSADIYVSIGNESEGVCVNKYENLNLRNYDVVKTDDKVLFSFIFEDGLTVAEFLSFLDENVMRNSNLSSFTKFIRSV